MKLSEFRKLIQEEVRKIVKEVGDSSAQPYPIQGLQSVIAKFKKQIAQGSARMFTGSVKGNINAGTISFTAEEGIKKTIYVGLNFKKKVDGLTMEVFLQDDNENRLEPAGKGNLYRLMSTVIAACKNITDSIPEIKELKFESYPRWSKGEDPTKATAATKFILSYVKQTYGNIRVTNASGDMFVKLLDRV